jgi:hypothetical protein
MIKDKDVKRKSRRSKILVIILSSSVALILMILLVFGLSKLFVRWFDIGTFSEYDPGKMVVYLEKRYNIDFPENIREVNAAKSGESWDGGAVFILKFSAKQSEVNEFLDTTLGTDLHTPDSWSDDRFNPYESTPDWWTKPIIKGEMGHLYVEDTFVSNGSSTMYVYIDRSDGENNVVYLQGTYKSPIDR